MIHMNRKTIKPIFAMFLSVILIVAILPINMREPLAATNGYDGVVTFEVKNGADPVQGATVHFPSLSMSSETDVNGIAAFNGADIMNNISAQNPTLSELEVQVSKDGYATKNLNISLDKKSDALSNNTYHESVELNLIIPADDYQITGYNGSYDGNPHSASVVAAGYTIKYSENNIDFDTTEPVIEDVGSKTVYVQISKNGYDSVVEEVILTVTPADRTDFAFATPLPADLDYQTGLTYTNAAESAQEPGTVEYESSDETIAAVDDDGKVSFLKAGSVRITATMAASTNYKESTANYSITVNTILRPSFVFATTNPSDMTYGENNNEYANTATNMENDGTISYSIVSQSRDGEPVKDVADIDPTTGKLTILASGTVEVKASVTAGDYYNADETVYSLTINRASQTGFVFDAASYEVNYGVSTYTIPGPIGGQTDGAITYRITSGEDIAAIDPATGVLTFMAQKSGAVTVKAVRAANACYNEVSATAIVNVVYNADFSDKYTITTNPVEDGVGTNGWYKQDILIKPMDGYKISRTNNLDSTGWLTELTYNTDGKYGSVNFYLREDATGIIGTMITTDILKLDKTPPTDLTIMINEKSVLGTNSIAFDTFYREGVTVKLSANCGISGLESLQYQKVKAVSEYDMYGLWQNYDPVSGIKIEPSEKFIIYFKAQDRAGNISIVNSTGIVVDDKMPEGETKAPEIDILPEKPNEHDIYNGNVKVDLKVIEPKYMGVAANIGGFCSGLNRITYTIFTGDTDAQETGVLLDVGNSITTGAVYDEDNLIHGWTGSITVDGDTFNSNQVYVQITATDNAGNTRTTTTVSGEIKIDCTAPEIRVSYDNNRADSGSYFKENRTATIVITERNFDAEQVVFSFSSGKEQTNSFHGLSETYDYFPVISGWTKTEGTGNEDDTTWTATLSYMSDGDYEFGVEYTDLAGWKCGNENVDYGDSVAPTRFTIDKTAPIVSVSYNNTDALNDNYYKADRVATLTITEHNLDSNGADANRVVVTMTATDDGNAVAAPSVSSWTRDGDTHTATVHYSSDAFYSFDIDVKDKAGNDSADYGKEEFYVDKTVPTLEITGVSDYSANNGDVIPVVSYFDTNYDANQVVITLNGANRGIVELDGSYSDIHNGRTFTFNNFKEEVEIDDIYTLTGTLTDKAGNTTTKTMIFSVNRFGSTYALTMAGKELNGTYVKEPIDVVITETNVNALSNIIVTLFKDNVPTILTEGEDYRIDISGGNGQWYHYEYTIFAKNFAADGVYGITIESDDEAGNKAKNDQDTKNMSINFGVDSTLPIINIENVESNTTYATDHLTVNMSVKDNLKLTKVIVMLDGKEYKVWTNTELEEIIKNGGNFSFDIPGDSTDAHTLTVYAVDAAGNGEVINDNKVPMNAITLDDFYVTTNLWVRYVTNKSLFYGSIAGIILIGGWSVYYIVSKRRKSELKTGDN